MPRFFIEKEAVRDGETVVVAGEDAKHISLSLRARIGEKFTLCDGEETEYRCTVRDINKTEVIFAVDEKLESKSEPSVKVTLYQALTKSDKFDGIVQKSVELGVSEIVPVVTDRCVSRPDDASLKKKTDRWRKIAKEAAMQSLRGIIPCVRDAVSFDEALSEMSKDEICFVCYEDVSHTPMSSLFDGKEKTVKKVSFLVGPEGGIAEKEAEKCHKLNIPLAGLGPRILRTETAPLCVLGALMMVTGNLD